MSIVKVKTKYQVTLPTDLRKLAGVTVGDLLDAQVEKGKITLSPKSIIDRHIAESIEDFKQGRFIGPFSTTKEALRALKDEVKKIKTHK